MDYWKKQEEQSELDYFLDAYMFSTGEGLTIQEHSEAPDFICSRPDGSNIGIELTRIQRDPKRALFDKIIEQIYTMKNSDAFKMLIQAIKRKRGMTSERIILVLQLMESIISDLVTDFELSRDDFKEYGFDEIWVADYSGIEAYGDIELFCLHPPNQWGYYERPNPMRKPYG